MLGQVFASSFEFRRYLIENPMTKQNDQLRWLYNIRRLKDNFGFGVRAECNVPDCEARINVSHFSCDDDSVVVKSFINTHNHNYMKYVHRKSKKSASSHPTTTVPEKSSSRSGSSAKKPKL